ncbi:peptide ABC transporter substrate-binding protein [Desmospora profundinema]|uniref:Oligopeptide transport system substrate-binding protein n=1 Tax=Desmospora profundinema TaxID=1571184 RepID=A0ABU1IHA5_9BACL|nr:peptide ABC transporter substrate-binding protein [Desmospora profundinema]MDR6224157.1 oligopeptide transport system substrate-binding protein [Desmospora profundinema]
MKRRWIVGLTWLTVLSIALVGCTGVNTGAPENEGSADENQVLDMTIPAEPPTLDHSVTTDAVSFDFILNNVMDGLYRLNKDNKPEPAIASGIDITEDKSTYTFSLREANWSDGEPVTAHDFEYAWKRALDPETKAEYAFILYPIKNAEAYNSGEVSADQVGVRAIDEKTLQVELEAPTPYFLSLTTFATYFPLREDIVDKYGNEYATGADKMVYNGPFEVGEWKHEQSLTLKKNQSYWDRNTVKLETVNMNIVKDTSTGVNLYTAGEVDVASLDSALADAFKKSPEYLPITLAETQYIQFNTNNEFLSNAKIRKAISYAVDRESITKLLQDGSEPAYSFVPPSIFTSDNQIFREIAPDGHQYNPQEAQRLLEEGMEELGFTSKPRLTLLSFDDHRRQVAVAIQEQLKNTLDLDINIDPQPLRQKRDREAQRDFELSFISWRADYNDPQTYLDMWVTGGPFNRADWSNKEYDKLINDSVRNPDNEERTRNYVEAEKILLEGSPVAPVFYTGKIFLQKQYVKGIYRHPVGAELTLKWAYMDGKE